MNPTNGVIMESGVIVVGVASLDGTRNLRFRIREVIFLTEDTLRYLTPTLSGLEISNDATIN